MIIGHPTGRTWNTNADGGKEHPHTTACRHFDKGKYTIGLSGRSEGNAIDKIVLSKFKNPILNFNDKKFEVSTKMEESAQNKILRQIFGTKKQISIYCIA